MKTKLIILFYVLINGLFADYAFSGLHKTSENSFVHDDSNNLPEQRIVKLLGVTNPENIASYAESTIKDGTRLMKFDRELNIQIVSVLVVKLFIQNSPDYNGVIAYIIRTKDGRFFLNFPYIIADRYRIIEDKDLDRVQRLSQAFGMHSTSAGLVIPHLSGDMAQFLSFGAAASSFSIASKPMIHHIWTTVELYSECITNETVQIPGRPPFTYQEIENSDFQTSP